MLTLFASSGVAGAQESSPALPDTSASAGETEPTSLGITLEQARTLAAEQSPVARIARAEVMRARGARLEEAGVFDPALTLEGQRVSTDSPVSSPFAGSETRQRLLSGGASWLSPFGTAVDLSFSRTQFESNAPFTTLPRERRARARVDVVQPLLRGFGPVATRGELRATSRELDAALSGLEAVTRAVEAAVENAYWETYAAERDLAVQRLQRQRAATFLRDQMLRGRAGAVGPGVVAIARTFLADQETALIDARLRLDAASDRLGEIMGAPRASGERYHALDAPPPPPDVEPLDAVMARALEANPALLAAEQLVQAARARERRAAWNAWPTLEAFGGYGGSGLAGTGRRIVFGSDTLGSDFDTGFGDAWDQVFRDDFPDWNVGLRLRMPIGWRSDRGEHERQRGLLEIARERSRAARLVVESAVRNAHREAESSRRSLEATAELVAAAEEQARIARLEYQAGRSTAYDLVNLEADVARARFRESQTLVRAARATAELRRLTTPATRRPRP